MLSLISIHRRLFGIRNDRNERPNIEWPRVRIVNRRGESEGHVSELGCDAVRSDSVPSVPADRDRRRRRCCPRSPRNMGQPATTESRPTTNTATMPLLYSLARTWAWEAVIFRCQTNPHEASEEFRDHLGDTCLHWAVFGRPPVRAVQAILNVCPATASVPNDAGLYALHVACAYRASSEVIEAVRLAYPRAVLTPSRQGVYPIHLLCDSGGNGCESMLAILNCPEGMESVFLVDPRFQRRPLYVLNERKNLQEQQEHTELVRNRRLRQRAIRQKLRTSGQVQTSDWEEHGWLQHELITRLEDDIRPLYSDTFWETVVLVIVAEYQSILASLPVENSDHSSMLQLPACMINSAEDSSVHTDLRHSTILHACIGNPDCPPSLQEYALLLYEPFLLVQDERGRCALHLAAFMYASNDRQNASDLISRLLEACPEAASMRDVNGRLPLSVALEQNCSLHRCSRVRTRGLVSLIEAFPLALLESDIRIFCDDTTGAIDSYVTTKSIYPVVFARLSPNALYSLFNANPSMMLRSTRE